jgi:RNA polymerase sigma-70 factor (ECF subfamily)
LDEADAALVARSLAGQAEAFDELCRRHRPGLVRFAALIIGDADEAESVAQEALGRAFRQLASFQPGRAFRAWLRGIALNVCRNYLRDRTRHARGATPDEVDSALDPEGRRRGVLSGVLRRELRERLWLAIDRLPIAYREAFLLHYAEGLDYAEMSEITGASPGALRARALRARALLRGDLGDAVDTWVREARDESTPPGKPV